MCLSKLSYGAGITQMGGAVVLLLRIWCGVWWLGFSRIYDGLDECSEWRLLLLLGRYCWLNGYHQLRCIVAFFPGWDMGAGVIYEPS
jgi:hypothetical protein